MLIDSKFRDYYDSIKSFGIDKTVVFNRKTTYISKQDLKLGKDFHFRDLPQKERFQRGGLSYEKGAESK